MTSTTIPLTSADGTRLHATWSQPEGEVKATIVHVHGLGEHSGRHTHVTSALVDSGYAVENVDLRGHGRSPGGRGHTPFAPTMDDLEAALDDAQTRVPDVPRFLYGHSLGGLLVLTYCLKRNPDLNGVVCTSAGLRSPVLEQRLKITAAKALGSVLPSLSMPTGLDDSGLSRDPAVLEAYRADPLVHDRASFALGRDAAIGAEWALANAAQLRVPVLLIHGSDDQVTYASGTEQFARAATGDVTVTIYDGLLHETHNEPEKATVLADIVAWLDAHLA